MATHCDFTTKTGNGITYSPPNSLTSASDFISSSSAGQGESYEMLSGSGYLSNIPAGTWSVMALVCSSWAEQSGAAPQTLEYYYNECSTAYTFGAYIPGASYAGSGPFVQATNPATSAAWSTSDFSSSSYWGAESAT